MGYLATRAPSARFVIGRPVGGVIVDARQVQTSEYNPRGPGRPEYWENKTKTFASHAADGTPNDPKAQLELTVETGEPDPETGDTERRIFIKNKRQFAALREALKKARARQGLVIGGSLFMTQTGKEASNGGEDANTWEIEYVPPAVGADVREVPEEVHLIGGGTWRKGQNVAAAGQLAERTRTVLAEAAERREAADLGERTRFVADQLMRAQASSPLAERLGLNRPKVDEEPPF